MNDSAIIAMGAAIPNLPFVAVAIVGLVLSISRRSRFPRGAHWATVGFACLLLQVGTSLMEQVSVALSTSAEPSAAYLHSLVWMNTAMYLLRLAGLIALAMAVFAERAPAQRIAPCDH